MTETLQQQYFLVDFDFMDKAIVMKNVIKVPITFAAEMVKFYPEFNKRMYMPYEEIKEGIEWHKKYMPKIPITIDHVEMHDEEKNVIPPNPEGVIGHVQDLSVDDDKKVAKGWAYIKKSRIDEFLSDYLTKGHIVGTSVGGFAQQLGPAGVFHDENYDNAQMKLRFHHIALVTQGLPRCPPNICGFNVEDNFFNDAMTPWIEEKYGNLQVFSDSFLDSDALQSCVSAKIEYLYHEKRSKKEKINRDQIAAHAYSHCRNKLGIKESINFSPEEPEYDFQLLHSYLRESHYLSRNSCMLDFYKAMKNEWKLLESSGIINDNSQELSSILKKIMKWQIWLKKKNY